MKWVSDEGRKGLYAGLKNKIARDYSNISRRKEKDHDQNNRNDTKEDHRRLPKSNNPASVFGLGATFLAFFLVLEEDLEEG